MVLTPRKWHCYAETCRSKVTIMSFIVNAINLYIKWTHWNMYFTSCVMKNDEHNDLPLCFIQIEQQDCEFNSHSRCSCFSVLPCTMQVAWPLHAALPSYKESYQMSINRIYKTRDPCAHWPVAPRLQTSTDSVPRHEHGNLAIHVSVKSST
jgi:hypothetical protein